MLEQSQSPGQLYPLPRTTVTTSRAAVLPACAAFDAKRWGSLRSAGHVLLRINLQPAIMCVTSGHSLWTCGAHHSWKWEIQWGGRPAVTSHECSLVHCKVASTHMGFYRSGFYLGALGQSSPVMGPVHAMMAVRTFISSRTSDATHAWSPGLSRTVTSQWVHFLTLHCKGSKRRERD
jgi:hypothetical protein